MNPWVRLLYVVALMQLIAAPGSGNPHGNAVNAVVSAAAAFLWDACDYYLKREGGR